LISQLRLKIQELLIVGLATARRSDNKFALGLEYSLHIVRLEVMEYNERDLTVNDVTVRARTWAWRPSLFKVRVISNQGLRAPLMTSSSNAVTLGASPLAAAAGAAAEPEATAVEEEAGAGEVGVAGVPAPATSAGLRPLCVTARSSKRDVAASRLIRDSSTTHPQGLSAKCIVERTA
jgi:hypothetical protein